MGLKAVANPAAGGQPGSFTTLTVTGAATIGDGLAVTGIQTITANSAEPALSVTQSGSGPALSADGTIKAYAGQFIAQESTPPPGKRVSVSVVGDNYGDMYAFDATAVAAIPLVMQRLGGNVLIGSTTDNGAKLQVAGSISATDYIAGAEQTPPSAPAANGYRIFAQDNGAGKTQLMVIFATGAAQQIAIEP